MSCKSLYAYKFNFSINVFLQSWSSAWPMFFLRVRKRYKEPQLIIEILLFQDYNRSRKSGSAEKDTERYWQRKTCLHQQKMVFLFCIFSVFFLLSSFLMIYNVSLSLSLRRKKGERIFRRERREDFLRGKGEKRKLQQKL